MCITGSKDCSVACWSVPTGTMLRHWKLRGSIDAAALCGQDLLAVVVGGRKLKFLDLSSWNGTPTLQELKSIAAYDQERATGHGHREPLMQATLRRHPASGIPLDDSKTHGCFQHLHLILAETPSYTRRSRLEMRPCSRHSFPRPFASCINSETKMACCRYTSFSFWCSHSMQLDLALNVRHAPCIRLLLERTVQNKSQSSGTYTPQVTSWHLYSMVQSYPFLVAQFLDDIGVGESHVSHYLQVECLTCPQNLDQYARIDGEKLIIVAGDAPEVQWEL